MDTPATIAICLIVSERLTRNWVLHCFFSTTRFHSIKTGRFQADYILKSFAHVRKG